MKTVVQVAFFVLIVPLAAAAALVGACFHIVRIGFRLGMEEFWS